MVYKETFGKREEDPLAKIDGPYTELRSYLYKEGKSMVLPHPSLGFGDPSIEMRLSPEAQALLPKESTGEVKRVVRSKIDSIVLQGNVAA